MNKRRVTLRDIAERAKLSRAAVSFALRNHPRMPQSTIDRVQIDRARTRLRARPRRVEIDGPRPRQPIDSLPGDHRVADCVADRGGLASLSQKPPHFRRRATPGRKPRLPAGTLLVAGRGDDRKARRVHPAGARGRGRHRGAAPRRHDDDRFRMVGLLHRGDRALARGPRHPPRRKRPRRQFRIGPAKNS